MSLRSRLSQLQAQTGNINANEAPPQNSALRSRLSRLRTERIKGVTQNTDIRINDAQLAERLDGKLIAEGLIEIKKTFPLQGSHGVVPLDKINLHPQLPGHPCEKTSRRLYIDTETTGLSGGSGTLAFLIGIAEFTSSGIELTQLLITRFSAESALLTAFHQLLDEDITFVSYNGKTYDLPLLNGRFLLKGIQQQLCDYAHLDLLHPIRRLFSNKWPNCRLITVENRLLDFYRDDDLPGSEAPEAWFNYLRAQQANNLVRVVEHNMWDIFSLAIIHAELADIIATADHADLNLAGLARWLEQNNETEAKKLLEKHRDRLTAEEQRLLALYYRRAEQWHEAVSLWQSMAMTGCTESMRRLAKYHEHIDKDVKRALDYCEQLGNDEETLHRKQRLQKKLSLVANNR